MNDSAPTNDRLESDADEAPMPTREEVIPGFQPPSRTRYRPSEAWALRWLGTPAA